MWWKRIKKKQIEAGILLYALFISAVFSLLLQFYLNRQVAERRILLASQHRIQAYAQAQLAIDNLGSGRKNHNLLNWPSRFGRKIRLCQRNESLTRWGKLPFHLFSTSSGKEKNRQKGKGEAGSRFGYRPLDHNRGREVSGRRKA